MTGTKVYERNGWLVRSYGNGWAYELRDTQEGTYVWFQDDDAHAFRERVMDEQGFFHDACEDGFADYGDVMQPIA